MYSHVQLARSNTITVYVVSLGPAQCFLFFFKLHEDNTFSFHTAMQNDKQIAGVQS